MRPCWQQRLLKKQAALTPAGRPCLLQAAGSFLLLEGSAENSDTGSEETAQHWAPRCDVADGHRAMEHCCMKSGMSYCEDGHSWDPVVRVVAEIWVVFRPKKVLGGIEGHGGR